MTQTGGGGLGLGGGGSTCTTSSSFYRNGYSLDPRMGRGMRNCKQLQLLYTIQCVRLTIFVQISDIIVILYNSFYKGFAQWPLKNDSLKSEFLVRK